MTAARYMSASKQSLLAPPYRLGRRPTDLLHKSADERLPIDLLPLALHPVGGAVMKQQEALHMHRESDSERASGSVC